MLTEVEIEEMKGKYAMALLSWTPPPAIQARSDVAALISDLQQARAAVRDAEDRLCVPINVEVSCAKIKNDSPAPTDVADGVARYVLYPQAPILTFQAGRAKVGIIAWPHRMDLWRCPHQRRLEALEARAVLPEEKTDV